MPESRPRDPEDEGLGNEIAAAAPDDALDARVSAVAYLREHGRKAPRVVVGGYELERRIGEGGFGRVYLATQHGLARKCAVKLLHRHRATPGAEWLRREASALAQLSHPNVVQVFEVGSGEHGTFIAMEYVDGGSLSAWQTGRAWQEVLAAYQQAALGLAAAHARGILHLDFKPTNALIGRDGRVRVADFGLAGGSVTPSGSGSDSLARPRRDASADLQTRAAGGTDGYASPEQSGGRSVRATSDQFSFCAALYEALHGELPYTPEQIAGMSERGDVTPQMQRGSRRCPRWLDRVLQRGLSPRPEQRWPSMSALLDALRERPWYRRLGITGALVASAVFVPVFAIGLAQGADHTCIARTRELLPVWDIRTRDDVLAAFSASGLSNGPRVVQRLERDVEAALDVALSTCAGTPPDGDTELVDARQQCMVRHSERFDRVVELLIEGGRPTSENADALLEELHDPHECTLESPTPTQLEGPRELETRAEIELARLDIAAARFADADDRAHRALALAQQLERDDLAAEALLARGRARDGRGLTEAALEDFDESGLAALSLGRDELAAQSWRAASWVASYDLGDLARADRWARLSRAALQRLGEPARQSAEQLDTEGLAERLRGDLVAAETKHRAALVQLERSIEPDDPRWISTWLLLAHVLADRGDMAGAMQLYERSLGLAREQLGDAHPIVATVLTSRALVARDNARSGNVDGLVEADRDLTEAGAMVQHNPVLAMSIATLHGEILLMLGRLDEARMLADQAWQLQKNHLPVGHHERGSALSVLARVELARHDWDAALAAHLAYVAELHETRDVDALAEADNNIGWLLCRVDRCPEARSHHARALARGDQLQQAYAEAGLGHVELDAGDPAAAVLHLEGCLAMAENVQGGLPPDLVAEAQWHLARARLELGEADARIRPLLDESLAFYRASGTDELAVGDLRRLMDRSARERHSSEQARSRHAERDREVQGRGLEDRAR